MARPNRTVPAIEAYAVAHPEGFLSEDALTAVLEQNPSASPRSVQHSLLSLFERGYLGRAYEWVFSESGRPVMRRMRYWWHDAPFASHPEGYESRPLDTTPRREK
jgi:hypothetical protein